MAFGASYASIPQTEPPMRPAGPLGEKLGSRAYDGGPFNSPFADKGRTKAAFYAPGPFNPYAFMKPMRRRLNIKAILECIVLPVAVFSVICWLYTFQVRNMYPWLGHIAVTCALLMAIVFAGKAIIVRRKLDEEEFMTPMYFRDDDPRWFMFLAGTIFMACFLGFLLGEALWVDYMQSYYELALLGTRTNVDPVAGGGEAYLDAGVISFKEGATVDVSKAIGYKDSDVYCVAPITFGDDDLAYYDFWAVGVNCCTGFPKNFECFEDGRVPDPRTHSAMRLMDDSLRPYYRVAVEMAQAEFYKKAEHPLFFTWTKDPVEKVTQLYRAGRRYFWFSVVVFTALQTMAVCAMAYRSWKNRMWG